MPNAKVNRPARESTYFAFCIWNFSLRLARGAIIGTLRRFRNAAAEPRADVYNSRMVASTGHVRRAAMLVLGIALAAASSSGLPASEPAGAWAAKAPAPSKRTEVVAAAVGGKIYVVGGFGEPKLRTLKDLTISDAVEEYDPASDRWTVKAPLPIGLHHAGAAAVGDRLYVIGGFTQSFLSVWSPVSHVYAYDPAADAWTERAPMPTARGALAVAESGGKLFAIGGYDGRGNSGAVEVYDPAANTWRSLAPLPTPRDHLAAAAVGSKIFAIAGRLDRDYGRNLSVTESYDPATNQWTRVADLPTPRSGITAGVIHGVIYVLGGEAPEGTFRTNEAYLPEKNRWETQPPMPTARHGLGSAVVSGRLYVLSGGPTPGGSFSNVNEVFSPGGVRPAAFQSSDQAHPPARASRQQVRTIMALLATFDDAGTLPPESSPEANDLIKALIQLQAALMKSAHPAVRQLLTDSLTAKWGEAAGPRIAAFRAEGWTSDSLEAVLEYLREQPVRDRTHLAEGLQPYNIGRQDLDRLASAFRDARDRLAAKGQDLHAVYAAKRREMF